MLLGGKGGCQQCTCVPCDPCERTCTNPHTGTAFEAVYTRYFEGAEAGNTSDGYLSATGDSDTSDPYNGMDGTGPWFQQITGSFTLDSTQTRFPCRVTVSFWRNQYGVGVQSIPPPSTALTFQGVFVEVSSGAVIVGDRVIVPADGEVQITSVSIPLVTGGGDQSSNDPRRYEGGISIAPQCESASFSIRATINWNTQRRQHVLYGIVRECYEEGTPCATFCSGLAPPNVAYLTISNYTGPTYDSPTPMDIEGTYVLERAPGFCNYYYTYWNSNLCFSFENPLGALLWAPIAINSYGTENHGFYMGHYVQIGGVCGGFELFPPNSQFSICGSGVLFSGTNGRVRVNGGTIIENAFDWEIEA
jgi:hypothetical protein